MCSSNVLAIAGGALGATVGTFAAGPLGTAAGAATGATLFTGVDRAGKNKRLIGSDIAPKMPDANVVPPPDPLTKEAQSRFRAIQKRRREQIPSGGRSQTIFAGRKIPSGITSPLKTQLGQ